MNVNVRCRLLFGVVVLAAVVQGSCGRSLGADRDGDGLTDRQEATFKTNPDKVDTDGDGIPDGSDPDPVALPRLTLTASPVFRDGTNLQCVEVVAHLQNSRGQALPGRIVRFEWPGSSLDAVDSREDGTYRVRPCTADRIQARVQATYTDPADPLLTASDAVTLSFIDPIVPGVNTTPHKGAGPIRGALRVYALSNVTAGTPKPFEGATVAVQGRYGWWPSKVTGPEGFVDYLAGQDVVDVAGPVDITVGAEGHRFTTYLGVDAASVAIQVARLDPVLPRDLARVGTIEGTVTGFAGEYGLPRFPPGGLLDVFSTDKEVPLALVQLSIKDVPLSSMSMGSVLEAPEDLGGLPIPSNMAICSLANRPDATCAPSFKMLNVPEGQYLLFALGGTASKVIEAIQNPYQLVFRPRAMAIARVQVQGGEVTTQDLRLNIDLRPEPGTTVEIKLGNVPNDWQTGTPFPSRLVMPVMDTGGEGFLWVTVDGSYNQAGFSGAVNVRFPEDDNEFLGCGPKGLCLKLNRLAVGLAGRAPILGGDPPGISTPVLPGVVTGDSVDFSTVDAWLEAPQLTVPKPVSAGMVLDAVSEEKFTGTVEWKPVVTPRSPDLYVLRVNYLTAAPLNGLIEEAPGTLGGPRSHCLWEFFVPADRSRVDVPVLPEDAKARPVLANPQPTAEDDLSPHRFGPKTVELELSAYVLGAGGKPFQYSDDFAYSDVNLQCAVVSQDSFAAETP